MAFSAHIAHIHSINDYRTHFRGPFDSIETMFQALPYAVESQKPMWSHERSRVGRSIYHIHMAVDISGSFLCLNVIRSLSCRWDQRVSCLVACCETSMRTILGNSVLLLLKADSWGAICDVSSIISTPQRSFKGLLATHR